MNFTNEYLTPDEFAKVVRVDAGTVRHWLREGQIPHTKFGRAVRVKAKDFEVYCKENEINYNSA